MPLPTAAEAAERRKRQRERGLAPVVTPSLRLDPPAARPSGAAAAKPPPQPPQHRQPAHPAPVPNPPRPTPSAGPSSAAPAPSVGGRGGAAAALPTRPSTPAQPPNGVVVSTRQRGNPVLAAIKAVPWAYGPTTADFLIPDGACALFLSLRYHLLHPNYLLARLRELRELTPLRLVLLLVDSEAPERPILTVLQQATAHECTLLLGWSVGEVARYVETLRAYAKKGAESIRERRDAARDAAEMWRRCGARAAVECRPEEPRS